MPRPTNLIEELMSIVEPRLPSPLRALPRRQPSPKGLSPLSWLFLVGLAAKVASAVLDPPPDVHHRASPPPQAQDTQDSPKPMPPDVTAKVHSLLREHPDQRDYILDELRWKGWRIKGL
jgi:hypothetical protein